MSDAAVPPHRTQPEWQADPTMAHLATRHDPYHVHKILGVLCLLHFAYRFGKVFVAGAAFGPEEPVWLQLACVAAHAALSWTSLLLPLPQTRNYASPMIWPEFRLHSIAFATRHAAATAISLLGWWPAGPVPEAAAKAALLICTVWAASRITERHGSRDRRTTNAMPYPASVTPAQQAGVKRNYVLAQFNATVQCVTGSATAAFLPLVAIQLAPLLMTLVRKNRITALTYHRVYAAALYLPYLATVARLAHGDLWIASLVGQSCVAIGVVHRLRCQHHVAPDVCWAIGACCLVAWDRAARHLHDLMPGPPLPAPQCAAFAATSAVLVAVLTHPTLLGRYRCLAQ
jgi:hypothetical protein